ncbi:reverse transcriptase domain-containing protein [Tanacetum coccineum]
MPVCSNSYPAGLFADPTWPVTPFVHWIEEYPLLDGLKIPSHVGSYDGKGDPDNFLHLFEGAIRMQKWLMPVACHMFTYTLKDSARICQQKRFTKTHLVVHSIKQREGESVRAFSTRYTDDTLQMLGLHKDQRISGFVHGLKARNLVEHLSTDLPSTYKGLMEKTYAWIETREVATNGALNDQRDNFERSRKSSWDNDRGQRSRDRFSPYRGPNHGFLSSLSKSTREILATEKVARSFEQPLRMLGSRRSRDMSKFCYFYEDHGHDTNDCRQLRSQIEEDVRTDQLSHLVKGIKKERTKTSDSQRGEKKEKSTTLAEVPILMMNQEEARTRNNISKSPTFEGREITFPPVTKGSNSSAPVIIKVKIFGREPSIQASKVDSQFLLVGFSGEKSWAIGEVLLEITIGNAPLTRSETLNFVIERSNSPYNMLLGRTTLKKMGMVVSTIHGAVKFHTTQGIGTVFSTHGSDKIEGVNKVRETSPVNTEGVLSRTDAEKKIIVNIKYLEQTVTIGKQLPERFKERLQNLLRTNADVFAWTHANMTGIPRTITINGKPFNMEHKLNEYSHIKPIKQKRRSLCLDRSTTTRKEVEELIRAGILREAVHQTWVANLVMVKKSDRGWRMCVDFTDINKACPKDCYPLPEIDWKMPFGLRNAGTTYQRLVDKVFNDQIGRNLEAYVDDMVIKSTLEEDMLADIKETIKAPIHGEVLMTYLAALKESINAALFVRREKGHVPIYFVSRVLQGAELNYPALGKLILTLSGHVVKWAIELGEHDIMFQTRDDNNKETPKYFLIEAPLEDNKKEVERKTNTKLEDTKISCEWKLYTDGASSSDGSGSGLMLIDPEDSQLLVNQVKGIYAAKQPAIREYLQRTMETLRRFRSYTIEHIRRNQNKKADALSKLASMTFEHLTKEVLVEVLARRSIEEKDVLQVETKEKESWMTPIQEYLLSGLLLEDPKESRKIRIKAPQYKLIKGSIYKKSFYTPWLHCIAPLKINDVIKEIHEGSCGFNMEPRLMVVRIT